MHLNKMNKTLKDNKGFTLTEIVVVIAIIGVLAVALVPKLNSFLGKADKIGAVTDFQSSFSNLLRAEMIEHNQLPSETELTNQLRLSGFKVDTAFAEPAVSTTLTDEANGVEATLTNASYAEINDGNTKDYVIVYEYDSLGENKQVKDILFIATNTADEYTLRASKATEGIRDVVLETDSYALIKDKALPSVE